MRVYVERGRCAGVAKPPGNGNDVLPVIDKHGGHCVPESVRVDVRQSAADGEGGDPSGDRVRVHGLAVVLDKQVISSCPLVAVLEAQLYPPLPVTPQQCHSLGGQLQISHVPRLGGVFLYAGLRGCISASSLW